jgi:hypothetical protein
MLLQIDQRVKSCPMVFLKTAPGMREKVEKSVQPKDHEHLRIHSKYAERWVD